MKRTKQGLWAQRHVADDGTVNGAKPADWYIAANRPDRGSDK